METKSSAQLAGFIELMADAVVAVDADAHVVFASAACERIFGYTPQEMIGKRMFDMMVPEDRDRTQQSVGEIMSGQLQLNFENRYIRKDGQIVHIMWTARWSAADQLRIGVARDITERKQAESMQAALYAISEAAHAAEDLLTLFQRIHHIVGTLLPADNFSITLYDKEKDELSFPYYVDAHERPPESSKPAGTLYAETILSGQPLLLTPDTIAARLEALQVSVCTPPLCWLCVPLRSHKDTIGALAVKSYPGGVSYSEKEQALLQFVSTQIATVIERQQMRVRLQHMAQYDQLTTLPNRGFLYDRLKVALTAARQEQAGLSLLYLDLDEFKQVNDTLGHHIGDLLLQEVAMRLKQCVRQSDTVARVGGDEFVILLQRVQLPEQAVSVAEKIRNAMKHPFTIDGHSLTIMPSIGIAHSPEHGEDEQQLLKHADKAMYFAKKSAKSINIEQKRPRNAIHLESPD